MDRMKPVITTLFGLALALAGAAQNTSPESNFAATLSFESTPPGVYPNGWSGGPADTIHLDQQIVHEGKSAVRIERTPSSANGFSTLTRMIPLDFSGTRLEWRGFLRTEGVTGYVGLWMREDGETPNLAFDNMQQRQVSGTRDWKEYSITLPIHRNARQLYFGVLLSGTGKAWADDLQLLVDGKPVWDAPRAVRPLTSIEKDHEFDSGSRIVVTDLSKSQIENLSLLGKVWGFLKYHHPAVVAGERHWDYDLFRILPKVVAASDRPAAQRVLVDWIRSLGDIPACSACLALPAVNLQKVPSLDWIRQESLVGRDLAALLYRIYRGRTRTEQFYVSLAPNVGNPVFDHELGYLALHFPEAGYQILSLYRLWNIVEYWYPNRDILGEKWDDVLSEFIPRMALAKTREAYEMETLQLIGRITDTHANLWSLPAARRPPAGPCQLPVVTRFVEDTAVVTGFSESVLGPATGLKRGDIIESLDGASVKDLVERWIPYYPASNRPTQLRDIGRALTRGSCGTVHVGIRRESEGTMLETSRVPVAGLDAMAGLTHDLPGATFRLFSNDVAYLKLSSVQAQQARSYVQQALGTKGLIVDIRNYPAEFVVFALGSLLVDRPTPFVRFSSADLENPGAFGWGAPIQLLPQQPHYPGKIVILTDEVSQSQAEYTAMALRSARNAIVVGSTTAGADGDVSQIPLPGGLTTMISGLGVFYPDLKPTQRVGIIPDIEVRPTAAGLGAGRDEVLERALREILGTEIPAAEIERLAR